MDARKHITDFLHSHKIEFLSLSNNIFEFKIGKLLCHFNFEDISDFDDVIDLNCTIYLAKDRNVTLYDDGYEVYEHEINSYLRSFLDHANIISNTLNALKNKN